MPSAGSRHSDAARAQISTRLLSSLPEEMRERLQATSAFSLRTGGSSAQSRRFKLMCVELLGGKCADCPFDDLSRPEAFDFDHRPGTDKVGEINRMIKHGGMRAVLLEIEKCDLVCANCHRTRTVLRHQEA